MKRSLANQISKLWNDKHGGSYEPTNTVANVVCGGDDFAVEIHASGDNEGLSFHYVSELASMEQAFKVSAYVTQDEEHK
jgi:hypothetical protein